MSSAKDRAMTKLSINRSSQEYDDGCFFRRQTLIDICCGPPSGIADCQLPSAD
jgi:hypothetical protein